MLTPNVKLIFKRNGVLDQDDVNKFLDILSDEGMMILQVDFRDDYVGIVYEKK